MAVAGRRERSVRTKHPYTDSVALDLRQRGPLTYADLAEMPDDGHRYELVDGTLIVTPAPIIRHQVAVANLMRVLAAAAPPGSVVLPAPVDIKVSDTTALEPDVVVLDRPDPSAKFMTAPPLLAVEVLSPSTKRFDVLLKRSVYEDFGVPSYWIVDPDEPSLLVLELRDGTYEEVASARGDDHVVVTRPFPVRIVPTELVTP